MNLLGLVPKLSKTEKEAIAWAVRNCKVDGYNTRLHHHPSYTVAASSQELYFLDAEDVLRRIRVSYSEKVPLIKKLENYIKTSKENEPIRAGTKAN